MHCPTCGAESPDGKRFCVDCGAPVFRELWPTAMDAATDTFVREEPEGARLPEQRVATTKVSGPNSTTAAWRGLAIGGTDARVER